LELAKQRGMINHAAGPGIHATLTGPQARRDPCGPAWVFGEFIIADAKDADMGFGVTAPGPEREECPHGFDPGQGCFKTLGQYRQQIRDVVRQELVDIVLLSASNLEQLAMRERIFDNTAITPAGRANDTSDVWVVRGGKYIRLPSRPFRSATIDHIKYGRIDADHSQPVIGAELGLYSVTFTNDLDTDYKALQDYQDFRIEAERKRFRYFPRGVQPERGCRIGEEEARRVLE
jgi:hypothetical protein